MLGFVKVGLHDWQPVLGTTRIPSPVALDGAMTWT